MKTLSPAQRFWVAMLVIGGYLLFGALAAFAPIHENSTIFITAVLSTMGPLVGWVIKGLFEPLGPHDGADVVAPAHAAIISDRSDPPSA